MSIETQPQYDFRTRGNWLTQQEARTEAFLDKKFFLLDVYDLRENRYIPKDQILVFILPLLGQDAKTFLLRKDFLVENGIITSEGDVNVINLGKLYSFSLTSGDNQLYLKRST
jgi:hypothetical protein